MRQISCTWAYRPGVRSVRNRFSSMDPQQRIPTYGNPQHREGPTKGRKANMGRHRHPDRRQPHGRTFSAVARGADPDRDNAWRPTRHRDEPARSSTTSERQGRPVYGRVGLVSGALASTFIAPERPGRVAGTRYPFGTAAGVGATDATARLSAR